MDQHEQFRTLARALSVMSSTDFDEARMEAEVEDDWTGKTYRVRRAGDWSQGMPMEASLDFAVDDALIALRDEMAQDGRPRWRSCAFTLRPDGTFTFDVSYPDERANR